MKHNSINNVVPDVRADYSKQVLFDIHDMPEGGHMLQVVTIPPRTRQRLHSHKIQTEVFYILEGECLLIVNGEEFLAKPGESFVCEPGDSHNLWNQSDRDFKILVFKINRPEGDEDSYWQE